MEINKDDLTRILKNTKCEWTKGYVSCLLGNSAPSVAEVQQEIAAELIDSCGNRKIEAVKKIRNNYNLGLKEAKAVVDEYHATGRVIGLPEDTRTRTKHDDDDDYSVAPLI